MYNLLVHAVKGTWDKKTVVLDRPRFLEHTNQVIADRFENLDTRAISKLESFPTLFAYEEPVEASARVGWIDAVRLRQNEIGIRIRLEPSIRPIRHRKIEELKWDLDIGKMELYRTHWAVKDVDLSEVLRNAKLIGANTMLAAAISLPPKITRKKKGRGSRAKSPTKVFIVHGRNSRAKEEVAEFLSDVGLEPIILHERPNGGRTLISKFQEESADVEFAVVLVTPDDIGGLKGRKQRPRARQNVIFELGFFIGKLGSPRVCALVEGEVERPSDFEAVVYIEYANRSRWKEELAREIRHAGIAFDQDKIP